MAHSLMKDLRTRGLGLWAYCLTHRCRPGVMVPFGRIAAWPDRYTVEDMRPRLRCTKCGATSPEIQPDWPAAVEGYSYPMQNMRTAGEQTGSKSHPGD